MRKKVIFLMLVLCGFNLLSAQSVLPGYRGYWERSRQVTILDLIDFYPEQLPFLRNEIYARYGRPFVNQIYRDYFRAQSWYQERSNFQDSWLSAADRANADFILSVEQSIQTVDEVTAQVLRNIEYTGGRAVLTFTSRFDLVWTDRDVDFGAYGLNGYNARTIQWAVMGDWILIYRLEEYQGIFNVIAYKVDHASKRIIGTPVTGNIERNVLQRLVWPQGRTLPPDPK